VAQFQTTITNQNLNQRRLRDYIHVMLATNHFIYLFCLLSKNIKIRIYKTIILPVVLCRYENWSLTLRKEHRLRVLENGLLRRIFDLRQKKWEEVGENCIMRSSITCT
jgi:hypothetical protein